MFTCFVVLLLFGIVTTSLLKNVPSYPVMFDVQIDQQHPQKVLLAFEAFVKKFDRKYENADERARRLQHFARKHQTIELLQKNSTHAGCNVTFGINHFADWSREEFLAMLSQVPPINTEQEDKDSNKSDVRIKRDALPEHFDLRDATIGGVRLIGPVKNQGACGCCWAFAVTALTEVVYTLVNVKHKSLSDQEICDCGVIGKTPGCVGGDPHNGLRYASEMGQTDSALYPYVDGRANKTGICRLRKTRRILKARRFDTKSIRKKGAVRKMMEHLVEYDIPVAVYFRVGDDFENYESGILESTGCDNTTTKVWHSAAIVGFGTDHRRDGRTIDYWILRNSWDTDWGENGYIRLIRGVDWCDIESNPVSAVLRQTSRRQNNYYNNNYYSDESDDSSSDYND